MHVGHPCRDRLLKRLNRLGPSAVGIAGHAHLAGGPQLRSGAAQDTPVLAPAGAALRPSHPHPVGGIHRHGRLDRPVVVCGHPDDRIGGAGQQSPEENVVAAAFVAVPSHPNRPIRGSGQVGSPVVGVRLADPDGRGPAIRVETRRHDIELVASEFLPCYPRASVRCGHGFGKVLSRARWRYVDLRAPALRGRIEGLVHKPPATIGALGPQDMDPPFGIARHGRAEIVAPARGNAIRAPRILFLPSEIERVGFVMEGSPRDEEPGFGPCRRGVVMLACLAPSQGAHGGSNARSDIPVEHFDPPLLPEFCERKREVATVRMDRDHRAWPRLDAEVHAVGEDLDSARQLLALSIAGIGRAVPAGFHLPARGPDDAVGPIEVPAPHCLDRPGLNLGLTGPTLRLSCSQAEFELDDDICRRMVDYGARRVDSQKRRDLQACAGGETDQPSSCRHRREE